MTNKLATTAKPFIIIAMMTFIHSIGVINQPLLFSSGKTIYIPQVIKSDTNYYAQGYKNGEFYGVWGTIKTADPIIREPKFSYIFINLVHDSGKWIETGWTKAYPQACAPKYTWATQPGEAHFVQSPAPLLDISYDYMIYKLSDGVWKLRIMRTDGTILYQTNISNPGMNSASQIQMGGEVYSISKRNDMGTSIISNLKYKGSDGVWRDWGGWQAGRVDYPPYQIAHPSTDPQNSAFVYGYGLDIGDPLCQ